MSERIANGVVEETIEQEKKFELPEKAAHPKRVYGLFLGIGSVISVVYGFQQFYPGFIGPLSNVIPSLLATGAFLAALMNARKYGFRLREREFDRIWFCFAVGAACWIFAEASWAVYYFSGIDVPYPGIPDVFYIAAYVPLSLAVFFYFRSFAGALTKSRRLFSIPAILASIILVVAVVLPEEQSDPRPLLTALTDWAYPAADLILLSLIILSLAIFAGGTISKWWYWLAGGIIVDIIGDELFLYQVAQGTYYNGGIDDLLYVWAYLIIGLAFYLHMREL
ncbi:MAG: hypothetical protein ACHQ1H_09480 [Nitrososphaerales archaeon]